MWFLETDWEMLSLTVTYIYLETEISQFGDRDQYGLFVMEKMLV